MTKVLIADDEEAILESTAAVLELFGVQVCTVSDPRKIMDAIRAEAPDLLLQDVRMPEFDVEKHVRLIRSDPALYSLPIVIFSAYVDAHEIAHRVGADGAIAKPFEPEELIGIIERVADQAHTQGGPPDGPAGRRPSGRLERGPGVSATLPDHDLRLPDLREYHFGAQEPSDWQQR